MGPLEPFRPMGLRDSLGPSSPFIIFVTLQNLMGPWESPWDHPGATGTHWDVMRKKDFSVIITSFLYLRNYDFSIIRIFAGNTCNWWTFENCRSVLIQNLFKHLRWIFLWSPYFSEFGPEILWIRTHFTQCH